MKRVKESAIFHIDGKVYTGRRHHEIIRKICQDTGCQKVTGKSIQGFVTEDGEFLTRAEAAKVALASGQIKKLKYNSVELFSEDLY